MQNIEQEMKFSVTVPALTTGSSDPLIRANWCEENIGERRVMWIVDPASPIKSSRDLPNVTKVKNTTFLFVNEHDATLFALRWAGVTV